jgi:hypothetical protein
LSVQLLQRSIAVEIDRTWIRAEHPARAAEHRSTLQLLDVATY